MLSHDVLKTDSNRCWFLSSPEAKVLSTAKERELLLELSACKDCLLSATHRRDGSPWTGALPDAEFQAVVRELASAQETGGAPASALCSLARRYQEVRGALAMANSRLVAHVVKRYNNRGIPASDLIQEGFCGLLLAIDRFDPANTTRLATYAVWWIRQSIQRAVAAGAYPVRLNPKQLRRLAQAIPQSGGASAIRPADLRHREVGERLPGWTELAAIRPRISLDSTCRIDQSTPIAELIPAARDAEPEEREQTEHLGTMIQILKPREQTVLRLRFGLDGESRHSLSQVSKVLEVSKERIRQIQERALEKLRLAASERDAWDPGASRNEPMRPSHERRLRCRVALGAGAEVR
jgi:RNA polymerase primary sigma factor